MIKRTDGERPAFLLDTEKTSYAFRIMPSGHPEHLHYGKKIKISAPEQVAALTEKRAFEPGSSIRYYNKDNVTVLEDKTVLVDGRFYIVGRRDRLDRSFGEPRAEAAVTYSASAATASAE